MTSSRQSVKRVRPSLGTFVEIELSARVSEARLHRRINRGFAAIEQIEALMSVHRPDSELSRLNRAASGKWLRLHPLTAQVLSQVETLHRLSGGVFDVRTGKTLSTHHALTEQRGRWVRKTGPWVFDLGGIAKGFAVDHAINRMRDSKGLDGLSGVVNAGGDLRVWGRQRRTVGIRIEGRRRTWVEPLSVRSLAVATSAKRRPSSRTYTTAAYRFPYEKQRLRPEAAAVFAPTCLIADALTKITLYGDAEVTRRCLAACQAHAVVYGATGRGKAVA